jgi:hypothetical protein
MRSYLFLPSFALCLVLLYMPSSGISEGSSGDADSGSHAEEQALTLSESGIELNTIDMLHRNSAAYFLNTFGVDTGYPYSPMRFQEDGTSRASTPIIPQDFASACLSTNVTPEFTAYGVSSARGGITGSSIVR